MGVLRDYSLVRRDTAKCILTVHRLVQAVQIDAMERDEQRQYAERVVRAVNEVFPRDPKEYAPTLPLPGKVLEEFDCKV